MPSCMDRTWSPSPNLQALYCNHEHVRIQLSERTTLFPSSCGNQLPPKGKKPHGRGKKDKKKQKSERCKIYINERLYS